MHGVSIQNALSYCLSLTTNLKHWRDCFTPFTASPSSDGLTPHRETQSPTSRQQTASAEWVWAECQRFRAGRHPAGVLRRLRLGGTSARDQHAVRPYEPRRVTRRRPPLHVCDSDESEVSNSPLTFGSVFALAEPPQHDTSLWSHIAVVNRPGWPIVVDPHCTRNTIWFINGPDSWAKLVLDPPNPPTPAPSAGSGEATPPAATCRPVRD